MKVILKNNSNMTATGEGVVNLPDKIWKELDWKIHDTLILNIEKVRGADWKCCMIYKENIDNAWEDNWPIIDVIKT